MLEKVYNPSEVDKKWSSVWAQRRSFTADADSDAPAFTIILPPPNITGSLTVGHALGTTIQDILCRWKRMKGFNVLWLPGTDHAGIATQKVVERALERKGLKRREIGRERFLEECWNWKEAYHNRIVEQLERLGASLDWTREVFTLDPGVSQAVREVFVRLYDKGLIYKGKYIVNWCPSCLTAISDEEVEFKETNGKLYYIAYPFADGSGELVVGTTRPETMLGDVAVALSPEDERAPELEGKELILPLTGRTIPVILDEAVDPSFGTGCLKVTPAHDATDFEIGNRHKLEPIVVIDKEGRMNEAAGRFAGLERYEARKSIVEALEEEGYLRKVEDYDHSVGHHDRCGTVIEPYISEQWFLHMEPLARPAIDVVEKGEVSFFPERWKNIYLSWMENIRDWCISRQLWWGHRIPVWYCNRCGEAIASVKEPEKCPGCGGGLKQDDDVLDTWFSSWLWTFSPMGWPNKTRDLEKFHPTDVLVTGGDIIFFWVARMVMASLEFMHEIPFSRVYITGIVRDAQGRKMSKSLGNSPDPIDIIERYGADAFRYTIVMLSPPGQDMIFDEKKVEVGRHFANKIWNASRFILAQDYDLDALLSTSEDVDPISSLYASVFNGIPDGEESFGWEDRWIVSRLSRVIREFDENIEGFRFDVAAKLLYEFFWHEFCDWYLELIKPELNGGGDCGLGSLITARLVLGASLAMLHPVMPFITEEIWSMLAEGDRILAEFRLPIESFTLIDDSLEADVEIFKTIVSTIRNLRQNFRIPPSVEVDTIINCGEGTGLASRIEPFSDKIRYLARVSDLKIGEGLAKPAGSAAAGLSFAELYIPLKGVVDIEVERKRLQKELAKLETDCAKIEKRLKSEDFIRKAPSHVVESEKARYAEMSDRLYRLKTILEDIS